MATIDRAGSGSRSAPGELAGAVLALAVDPRRPPTPAVAVAAAVARQADLSVEVVAADSANQAAGSTDAYLADRARDVADAGVAAVTWRNLGIGPPATMLVEHLRRFQPTLLCLATRSRGAISGLLLGSVSEVVVGQSPVPVLLVGPRCEAPGAPFDTVLAAVDDSTAAEAAACAGARLAGRLGAEVGVVEVAAPFESGSARRLARRLGPHVEYDVLHGHHAPAAVLQDARVERTAVIAVGARSRPGGLRPPMGSTALGIVRRAPGPVLVVPLTAAASPLTEPLLAAAPA